jgi:myosin-5
MDAADSVSKAYIPHDMMIWVAVDIIKEDPPGVYEIMITDPDFTPTATDPIHRIVDIKSYPYLTSLPLQNDIGDTGVPDMTSLNYLHEASILDNLRRRFYNHLPYTYTGDVCVAINPYKWLPIYTDELGDKYVGKLRHELEPHVYATSAAAFSGLKNYNHNQTILASGESGAGKTETVKILMRHIAHISNNKYNSTIEKVLKANPLMESFGNAKTARNDNSSRFGTLIDSVILVLHNNIMNICRQVHSAPVRLPIFVVRQQMCDLLVGEESRCAASTVGAKLSYLSPSVCRSRGRQVHSPHGRPQCAGFLVH